MQLTENVPLAGGSQDNGAKPESPPLPPAPLPRIAGLPEVDDEASPPSPFAISDILDVPDLKTFTSTELYDMNQDLFDDSVLQRPLIDATVDMSVLRAEYENGSPSFLQQIDWLIKNGYHSIRRARGDGDCFYRSLAFAYVERIMHAFDRDFAVASAKSILESSLSMLKSAGFEELVFEDFYDIFVSIINQIAVPEPTGTILTPKHLLEAFQVPESSNAFVVYLRLLTSAQIRTNPQSYADFLFHPETGVAMEPRDFCERFVDAPGKEADHVQIIALSRALQLNIDIAYLDGHGKDGHVNFVEFRNGIDPSTEPLILLYRPGHYDILIKEGV